MGRVYWEAPSSEFASASQVSETDPHQRMHGREGNTKAPTL